MISIKKQDELLDKINALERRIQNIYCTGDFEIARNLRDKVNKIKQGIETEFQDYSIGFQMVDINPEEIAQEEVARLEYEISCIEDETPEIIDKDIDLDIENNSTEYILEKLKKLNDDWYKNNNSVISNQEWDRKVARVMLGIAKKQAEEGKNIDLDTISQYCKIEDLIFVIKERFINRAQQENISQEEKEDNLSMARIVNKATIEDRNLWQKLTKVEDARVVGQIQDDSKESYALAVVNPNKGIGGIIDRIFKPKDTKPKTTVYTFGDINPSTLEWENTKVVTAEFPKKFSKRQAKRLIAIEINDVPEVVQEDGLGQYPNLERVTFGRNVKSIGSNVLSWAGTIEHLNDISFNKRQKGIYEYCKNKNPEKLEISELKKKLKSEKIMYRSTVKEIYISDSVQNLQEETFAQLPELMKISFGNSIEKIPKKCCINCSDLKEINLPTKLTYVGNAAFFRMDKREYFRTICENTSNTTLYECYGLKIPDYRYNNVKQYNKVVKFPESLNYLGRLSFSVGHPINDALILYMSKEQQEKFKDALAFSYVKLSDENDGHYMHPSDKDREYSDIINLSTYYRKCADKINNDDEDDIEL